MNVASIGNPPDNCSQRTAMDVAVRNPAISQHAMAAAENHKPLIGIHRWAMRSMLNSGIRIERHLAHFPVDVRGATKFRCFSQPMLAASKSGASPLLCHVSQTDRRTRVKVPATSSMTMQVREPSEPTTLRSERCREVSLTERVPTTCPLTNGCSLPAELDARCAWSPGRPGPIARPSGAPVVRAMWFAFDW